MKNIVIKSLLGIVLLTLLTGIWIGSAAAAAPGEKEDKGLKYALKLALIRLDTQQDHLDTARAAADVAEEFIQDEKAAGNDTSALEKALADLRAKIDEAQQAHDTAAQILKEKAGFDENGNVVDPGQARETLQNARQAMQEAAETMRDARQAFHQAMQDYRQSKRDKK